MLTVHESWSKACAKASTKFSARNRQDLWFERAAHHAGLTNYGDEGFSLFLRKAFIKGAGYSDEALDRKIIGVVNTGSDYIPCHGNMPQLLDAVCRGILLEGALPFKFPTISLHEAFSNPTSMYLRNLMSMDTEEMIKAQPMDAVILIGGCDKTVPAQLMGAISADIPALQLVVGPMVTGSHKDVRVGACTDCRGYWGKHRAGLIDIEEIAQVGVELVPSVGTCGVMGTASTMACIGEALGLIPLGGATPPANSSARLRVAESTGKLAVRRAMKPSRVLTRQSFENAITVLQAIGGSTNAVVHLLAIGGRVKGLDLTLDDFDRIGRITPLLMDLKPSGSNYMEDFHKCGGVPHLLRVLRGHLHLNAMTITGRTIGQEIDALPPPFPQKIMRPLHNPIFPASALAVLRGKALVFESSADLAARIDDPNLEVDATNVLVLQNIGPIGNPGMPEGGYIPIPRKLGANGITDMVRISDGRMRCTYTHIGTAYGAIILHISPEAALGGPLAAVRTGDYISLDVENRLLHLAVESTEIERRLDDWRELRKAKVSALEDSRGYRRLYKREVMQAHEGADFNFLRAVPHESV
ncbi:MAG: hypothetical protein CYPHOPRED_004174 [Cyphobasidiales sp. Tagirdzhanova-0007]|nr:MAG: hypothetical protein CYPHOPRED_004174 [Cyphobasidiales sp. Tagirdzhanova-0007]